MMRGADSEIKGFTLEIRGPQGRPPEEPKGSKYKILRYVTGSHDVGVLGPDCGQVQFLRNAERSFFFRFVEDLCKDCSRATARLGDFLPT